jgi:hypothetical protein
MAMLEVYMAVETQTGKARAAWPRPLSAHKSRHRFRALGRPVVMMSCAMRGGLTRSSTYAAYFWIFNGSQWQDKPRHDIIVRRLSVRFQHTVVTSTGLWLEVCFEHSVLDED